MGESAVTQMDLITRLQISGMLLNMRLFLYDSTLDKVVIYVIFYMQ